MKYVLAKITAKDLVFFMMPNLITRDISSATLFTQQHLTINGFHYMPYDKAIEEVKKQILKNG